jgi:hypothetical protein
MLDFPPEASPTQPAARIDQTHGGYSCSKVSDIWLKPAKPG